ncbi:MAG: hypothetical protein V2I46_12365 [Bacteroides sp.]|jgi:hypothetical protein|nr:hypothetical protein [Bacteroides sp.]
MKKMKAYALLFFLPVFFASCEPETKDLFFVDNRSDYEIVVRYVSFYNTPDAQVKIIPPQMNGLFFDSHNVGEAFDRGNEFLFWFETLTMEINDTLIISKDYMNRSNWTFDILGGDGGRRDGGFAVYTFTVEPEDIVPAGT